MEEDDRVISVTLDMPGELNSGSGGELEEKVEIADFQSLDEIREKILKANEEMLEAIGWFKAEEYYNQRYEDGEVKTLIVTLDSGVAYEKYPLLKEYILPGWDVLEDKPGGLDDEDVEFEERHGTIGAEIMGVLSPESRIVPIRTSTSTTKQPPALSNVKLGLEIALTIVKNIEDLTGREYNVVVNMSAGFWLNPFMSMDLDDYWLEWDYAEDILFPRFKDEWSSQIKEAGYNPKTIEYRDLDSDEELLWIAGEWLFDAMYVKGSLSPKLEPIFSQGRGGTWFELAVMKDRGWMILAPAGNRNPPGFKAYPAATDEAEAVEMVDNLNEEGKKASFDFNVHGNWTELAGPADFKVYNPDQNSMHNTTGTCQATFITSAIYARLWNIAPNLDRDELNRIVKGTGVDIDPGYTSIKYNDKKLIHPYRAIRVAWVYGSIKRYVKEYEDKCREGNADIETYNKLKEDIRALLEDTQDSPLYAATNIKDKDVEELIISPDSSYMSSVSKELVNILPMSMSNSVSSVESLNLKTPDDEKTWVKVLKVILAFIPFVNLVFATGCSVPLATPAEPAEMPEESVPPAIPVEPVEIEITEEPEPVVRKRPTSTPVPTTISGITLLESIPFVPTATPLPTYTPISTPLPTVAPLPTPEPTPTMPSLATPTPEDIRGFDEILDILIEAVNEVVPVDDLIGQSSIPRRDKGMVGITNPVFYKGDLEYKIAAPVVPAEDNRFLAF